MENSINFKREREIGKVISDSFIFFKMNFKPLFKRIWKLILPYFILLFISYSFFSFTISRTGVNLAAVFGSNLDFSYFLSFFIYIFITIIYVSILQLSVLNYIKEYVNNVSIEESELKKRVYRRFFSMTGLNFLIVLISFLGFLLFFIPGVYMIVVLVFAPVIFIFENKDLRSSISESFTLIKNNWWTTFTSLVILVLITFVINMVLGIIFYIYSMIKAFVVEGNISEFLHPHALHPENIFYYFLNLLLYTILLIIINIALSMIYFNIIEKRYNTNVFNEIDKIGSEL
ncbi:MAG TPA: hypothetical protein ENK91_16185 [Bacteroidetes bacterium]|nr:hypothetical protein [Bacteroidota bacterium]